MGEIYAAAYEPIKYVSNVFNINFRVVKLNRKTEEIDTYNIESV